MCPFTRTGYTQRQSRAQTHLGGRKIKTGIGNSIQVLNPNKFSTELNIKDRLSTIAEDSDHKCF